VISEDKEYLDKCLKEMPRCNRGKQYQTRDIGNSHRRKLKFSPKNYDDLWIEQIGLCPICKNPLKDDRGDCVDHDHKTGKVRGILHKACNAGLGFFKDNPENMERAASYVRTF